MNGITPNALEFALAKVAADKGYIKYPGVVVYKWLGNYVSSGEMESITEDALGQSVANFLDKIRSNPEFAQNFLYPMDEDIQPPATFAELITCVQKYLTISVRNFCQVCADRWNSSPQENVAKVDGDNTGGVKKKMNPGARTRLIAPADEDKKERFWQDVQRDARFKLNSSEFGDKLRDLFESQALSEREQHYFNERVSGLTYPEIAERDGGTPDKYRKIIDRAIAKLQKSL